MPKESDGSSLLSASDRAIYQYLDEMLSDPSDGSGSRTPTHSQSPDEGELSTAAVPAEKSSILEKHPPTQTQQRVQQTQVKLLKIKENNERKVLTGSDTLLGFETPIVVQQPVVQEPVKVEVKADFNADLEPNFPQQEQEQEQATVAIEPPKEIVEPVAKASSTQEVIISPQLDNNHLNAVDPRTVIESTQGDERLPPTTPWLENGRPEWAQGRFECLLFKVAGLKLAVPLVTLGSIHQIERKFNALPGQFDWFIGILQTNTGNIKVLDTALCVMPERYEATFRDDLQFVISIHGFEWGLACHELLKSVTLEPDDVKWRSKRGKRPWLAGTVVDQMCALVDTSGFHNVIRQAENKGR